MTALLSSSTFPDQLPWTHNAVNLFQTSRAAHAQTVVVAADVDGDNCVAVAQSARFALESAVVVESDWGHA